MKTLTTRFVSLFLAICCLAFTHCDRDAHVVVRSCEDGAHEFVLCEQPNQGIERICEDGQWVSQQSDCQNLDALLEASACTDGQRTTLACDDPSQTRQATCEDGAWITGSCHNTAACTDGETRSTLCENGSIETQTCNDERWPNTPACHSTCPPDERNERSCGMNDRGQRVRTCEDGAWTDTWLCLDPDICHDHDTVTRGTCVGWSGHWTGRCEDGQWNRTPCQDIALTGARTHDTEPTAGFCALDAAGTAHCWGHNQDGQLGRGHREPADDIAPTEDTQTFTDIARGPTHTCAITIEDTLYCWGDNSSWQLGVDAPNQSDTPLHIELAFDIEHEEMEFQRIYTGTNNSCLTMRHPNENGARLYCWGDTSWGQLLDATSPPADEAQHIQGIPDVTHVSIGHNTLCAIDGARAFCWGDNRHGLIYADSDETVQSVRELPNLPQVEDIAVGDEHICAISDQRVFCWGDNRYGQLGDGTTEDADQPIASALEENATAVYVGHGLSCAITTDHELYCWGSNLHGEIAERDDAYLPTPTHRPLPHALASLAISSWRSNEPGHTLCGATLEGRIACWGQNHGASIPDGSFEGSHATPIFVSPDDLP